MKTQTFTLKSLNMDDTDVHPRSLSAPLSQTRADHRSVSAGQLTEGKQAKADVSQRGAGFVFFFFASFERSLAVPMATVSGAGPLPPLTPPNRCTFR